MMYSITEFALSLKMFFAEQKAISHNVKYEPEKDRENGRGPCQKRGGEYRHDEFRGVERLEVKELGPPQECISAPW